MFPHITGTRRQVLASACIYIGQLLLGFTISWTVVILPKLKDPRLSPLPNKLTETQLSLVASLLNIGCIPGPYVMAWLSNVKGRKPCLFLGGLIASVGYIVLTAAKSLAVLYFGRILSGFGIGILGVMNLVYIGEIASTNIRGILLTLVGVTTASGGIILFTAGYFLSYAWTTFIGVVLSVAYTLAMLTIPETPIFHMLKGDDEAHCSGFMAVMFFASIIFDMAGSMIDVSFSMLIITAFQLSGSSVSPFLIESAGRKILLVSSSAVCSLSMFLLGLYFYLDRIGNPVIDNVKGLPLVLLIIFCMGYDFGESSPFTTCLASQVLLTIKDLG
ncbi:jg23627 [Pararge aegeria aegeria]|uniref:Jg23627 protein n=1 Tax=Pararge aegeria aegeria TaxID=348720 RepID=A0A8S4SHA3_9NEOP|nr:jg23627 [Pararge aegeria aegeria]